MHSQGKFNHVLLMVLACLLPLIMVFILMSFGVTVPSVYFWIVLLLGCLVMFYFMGGVPIKEPKETSDVETVQNDEKPIDISVIQSTEDVVQPLTNYKERDQIIIEGRLLTEPDNAYSTLKARFEPLGFKPLLQEDDSGRTLLILVPTSSQPVSKGTLVSDEVKTVKVESRFPWLNFSLFVLTLLTTTWAGAAHQGVNLWAEPGKFAVGLPYALALMLILGVHELGHYFTARYHGMKVTLPYFIPVPFSLGTFGAFIQMKSPTENRRALFDVGVSGPLAGLVVAIPALLIGLKYSTVELGSAEVGLMQGGASVGSSVLFALLAKLALGDVITEGHQLILHPLAFAGWLGLLVTALNLLPIGQLDGGHIAHALFGRKKGNTIGMVALFSIFLLGLFVWSGFLMWAIIVFFIAGTKSAPPLNDISPLDPSRVVIGAIAFILLFLILMPVPHAFYQTLGIHCPYV
jgi:membrane-associated protease RseP (regulator of RpoE activity)